MRNRQRSKRRRKGFTLMEVLLVMAILVILGSIVVLNFGGIMNRSRMRTATIELNSLKTQLGVYLLDVGTYPAPQEGLNALIARPPSLQNTSKWGGPYTDGGMLPTDPWGQQYEYTLEGVQGQGGAAQRITIFSKGPDMQPNTEDDVKVVFGG